MTVQPLRYLGDPVLKTWCEPVTRFDAALEALVTDLLETVDAPGRAGLAAPQIGVGLRAFSYNVKGRHGYVLNPELVEVSDSLQDGLEGCLSVPELYFPTTRAKRAIVRGVDLRNEPVVVEGRGELARCLQHETDHLDGRLYLARWIPGDQMPTLWLVKETGDLERAAAFTAQCDPGSVSVGALGRAAVCLVGDDRSDIWTIDRVGKGQR